VVKKCPRHYNRREQCEPKSVGIDSYQSNTCPTCQEIEVKKCRLRVMDDTTAQYATKGNQSTPSLVKAKRERARLLREIEVLQSRRTNVVVKRFSRVPPESLEEQVQFLSENWEMTTARSYIYSSQALNQLSSKFAKKGRRTEASSCFSAATLLFTARNSPDPLTFFQNVLKDDSPEWQEYSQTYFSWKKGLETTLMKYVSMSTSALKVKPT